VAKRGRHTRKEQDRRLKQLLGFIFIFRYATRKQLDMFVKSTAKLLFPRRIIEFSLTEGYISAYKDSNFSTKIYHLTKKGKDFISNGEFSIKHYHFEKRHAGSNNFVHHNKLVETYFQLNRHLEIKKWLCEWVLRVGMDTGRLPDAAIILHCGTKIALEVETSYKGLDAWEAIVTLYRYAIESISKYHAVLVVATDDLFEGIETKLYNFDPEFSEKAFILSTFTMLKEGRCFYQGHPRSIKEVVSLLKTEREKNGEEL